MYITGVFVFFLGIAIGSFLNVVILRYDTGRSVRGRSSCPNCAKTLTWSELIPVFSFIIQGAKCRSCRAGISWQYPIVELLTGVLFLLATYNLQPVTYNMTFVISLLFYFSIISLLMVIAVYDFHHKIIPNPFVYSLIILSGVFLFVDLSTLTFVKPALWDVLAGPILFTPFALLWLVSGGRWMGFGDAKLAIAIGWLLGLRVGLSAVVLGFWIGAVYSLAILLSQRLGIKDSKERLNMKSEVPFGPFLVIGTLLGLFFSLDVMSLNYLIFLG